MNVCVIGAGQSGLVTCKTFIEMGYNVIVLEKTNHNGLFSEISQKDYFKWSSSRYISGFSDFPIPKSYPVWMTIRQYYDYLISYRDNFKLNRYIRYNSKVLATQQIANLKWKVIYQYQGVTKNLIVDKLIVSSGLNSVPKYPRLKNYTGLVVHTHDIYKMSYLACKKMFTNRRILLIGGGESAFDIGHLCLKFTDSLFYTTKTYIEWFPDWGLDSDFIKNNETCFKKTGWGSHDNPYPSDTYLSYLEYSLPTPISGFWHNYGRDILLNKTFNLKNRCTHNHTKLCNITKTPNSLFKKYVVKRFPFICDLHNNKVKVVEYPAKYLNKNIVLPNNEILTNIDIIICATGYQKHFPFLDPIYYKTPLIKKIIPVKTPNLAFIGFARPTMGSINNVAEIQSWWASLYFQNKLNYKTRDYQWGRPQDPMNIDNNFVDTIVIGNYYYKDLAQDMNISPNLIKILITKPKLWFHIMHSTIHPMLYRLQGTFQHPKAEQYLLETLPNFNEKKNHGLWKYYLMFLMFHLVFILLIFLVSWLVISTLSSCVLIKYPKTYILLLSFLLIVYTYYYWH